MPVDDTPFAALTLIVAPAILTNASSVLALGTSNRFARAVDRQRQLSDLLEGNVQGSRPLDRDTAALRLRQLRITEQRGQLLLRALTSFYVSLGSFASAALVSLLGAALVPDGAPATSLAVRVTALLVGVLGVGGLAYGCTLLVGETRLALRGLRAEAAFSKQHFASQQLGKVTKPDAPAGSPEAAAGGDERELHGPT